MRNMIIMAFMLFSVIACGQNNTKNMDDKEQIVNLYRQMYQAMIAKDIAALDTILADGSVLVHMTGTRQPKKQYLHEIENGTLNYYSVEDNEITITVDGMTAEMTGRSRVNAAVYGGGRHTWRLQMKSKLTKTDGRWQFVESKASTY
jgi:ketosteroid isomerase-like protein